MLPFIARKHIWLFTPSRNGSPWWYLIHEEDWVAAARPRVKLGMSLCVDRMWPPFNMATESPLPTLSRPVPAWSTLPENPEFRWW
jgi:hypothetical protein